LIFVFAVGFFFQECFQAARLLLRHCCLVFKLFHNSTMLLARVHDIHIHE